MNKILLFIIMLFFVFSVTLSQTDVYVDNGTISIDSSSQLFINGSIYFNGKNCRINNNGILDLTNFNDSARSDFMNNSSDTLCSGTGTYKFSGYNYQHISGKYGVKFHNLEINNKSDIISNIYSIKSFINIYVGDSSKNEGILNLRSGNILIDNGKSISILNNNTESIIGYNEYVNITGKLTRRVDFSKNKEYLYPLANNQRIYFPAKFRIVTNSDKLKEVSISSSTTSPTDIGDSISIKEKYDNTLVYDKLYYMNIWKLSFNSGVSGNIKYDIYLSVKNQNDLVAQKYSILSRNSLTKYKWAALGDIDDETSPFRTLDDYARRRNLTLASDFVIAGLNRINFSLKVINLLTPNAAENNELYIEGLEKISTPLTVIIFNRWGVIVYRSEDYKKETDKWRGQSNSAVSIGGNELPSGTYYYVLKNNGEDIKTGFIHLQRE